MTEYYCDIGADTFTDSTGDPDGDGSGDVYTAPAGLQAAIRGTGNATALVAGDTLYIKAGTGDLSRLVLIDCDGYDASAWSPGDAIESLDGGSAQWSGVVVQANDDPAGNLGADDIILAWLVSDKAASDIVVADGINNTTKVETKDPIASVSTPGVQLDTNEGSEGSLISVVGVDGLWSENGMKATLDGNDIATNCINIKAKDHFQWRNIEFTRANGNCVNILTSVAYFHTFIRCSIHDSVTGSGVQGSGGGTVNYFVFRYCDLYNNAGQGAGPLRYPVFDGCRIYNNGVFGVYAQFSATFTNCVFYENTNHALRTLNDGNTKITNCVFDKNVLAGLYCSESVVTVEGCRFTENGTYGIEVSSANVYAGYNFFKDNTTAATTGSTIYTRDKDVADTNVHDGVIGYIDGDNAMLADRNYGLTNQATSRRQAVVL